MKKLIITLSFTLVLVFSNILVFAQEDLKQTTHEVKNWFAQNWQWVTGVGVVLLVLIAVFSTRKTNRKTTTIVKDDYGNVKSVTSTEIRG